MARLLVIVMPISIGAVTLFGIGALGLSLAGALILAAALAPTDPLWPGTSVSGHRAVGFVRSRLRWQGRVFLGWFGPGDRNRLLRRVLAADVLAPDEGRVIFWTAAACVLVSILVHGVTGAPLSARLLGSPSRGARPRWRGARIGAPVFPDCRAG